MFTFLGAMFLYDVIYKPLNLYGIGFWETYVSILKGIGALMMIVGGLILARYEGTKSKSFMAHIVYWSVLIGILLILGAILYD